MDLRGRSLLKDTDLSAGEFRYLVGLGARLRRERRMGERMHRLIGRNIALIFETASTRTRSAFEVAAHDQGAHVSYLGPGESGLGARETAGDVARVLGRMFDGIACRGFAQHTAETVGRYAGVPVWNGLTDESHPTQMLADILTMRDHVPKPLAEVSCCYLGDGRNNTASSLLVTGALLGMDTRICAPEPLQPSAAVAAIARGLASGSGARLTVTADVAAAVAGADYLYTDVWLSMGEPADLWDARIDLLVPYQVNKHVLAATGNPAVKFMHCLSALHSPQTDVGRQIHGKRGLDALEVTGEVFESPAFSSSTRPRTDCTPSRRSWSPPSATRHKGQSSRRAATPCANGASGPAPAARNSMSPARSPRSPPVLPHHDMILTHGNGSQVGVLGLESASDPALSRPTRSTCWARRPTA